MGSLTVWKPPLSMARLYEYEVVKALALKAREKHTARVDLCNNVLKKLESNFPVLLDELNRLELAIRNATKGVPDTEGRDWVPGLNVNKVGGERLNAAHWIQVKRFFKTLAKTFHPDHGGDTAEFAAIEEARRHGDLDYLRVKFATSSSQKDPWWRQNEGIEFWHTQRKKADVNLTRLQGTSIFKVVQAHLAGNRAVALKLMELELLKRRFEFINELNHVLKRNPSPEKHDG